MLLKLMTTLGAMSMNTTNLTFTEVWSGSPRLRASMLILRVPVLRSPRIGLIMLFVPGCCCIHCDRNIGKKRCREKFGLLVQQFFMKCSNGRWCISSFNLIYNSLVVFRWWKGDSRSQPQWLFSKE